MPAVDIQFSDILPFTANYGGSTGFADGHTYVQMGGFAYQLCKINGANKLEFTYLGVSAGGTILLDGVDVTPSYVNDGVYHTVVISNALSEGTEYTLEWHDGSRVRQDKVWTITGSSSPTMTAPSGWGTIVYPQDYPSNFGTDLVCQFGPLGGTYSPNGDGRLRFKAGFTELWGLVFNANIQAKVGDDFGDIVQVGGSVFQWVKLFDSSGGNKRVDLFATSYLGPLRFVGGAGLDTTFNPGNLSSYADVFYGDSIVGGTDLSSVATMGTKLCAILGTGSFTSSSPGSAVYTALRDGTPLIDGLSPAPLRIWIYAGTNDKAFSVSIPNFKAAYADMVAAIRADYTDTVIYCMGLWIDGYSGDYSTAIREVVAEAEDAGIRYVDTSDTSIWPSVSGDFIGSSPHLTEQGAEKASNAMAMFLSLEGTRVKITQLQLGAFGGRRYVVGGFDDKGTGEVGHPVSRITQLQLAAFGGKRYSSFNKASTRAAFRRGMYTRSGSRGIAFAN
jgi:hypothetical protein